MKFLPTQHDAQRYIFIVCTLYNMIVLVIKELKELKEYRFCFHYVKTKSDVGMVFISN